MNRSSVTLPKDLGAVEITQTQCAFYTTDTGQFPRLHTCAGHPCIYAKHPKSSLTLQALSEGRSLFYFVLSVNNGYDLHGREEVRV